MAGNTPTCPACGKKFSHSSAMKACKMCGLPDEVAEQGAKAVARWKRLRNAPPDISKSAERILLRSHSARKRKNRHGRKGVKR